MRKLVAGAAGLAVTLLALARFFGAPPTRRAPPPAENRALALGWGSFATTNVDVAPLNRDHTLSVRFLAAYDASYRGVIVADESGSYRIGMAPYASLGRPALELCVGGTTFTHPLPDAVLTDNDFAAGPPRQPTRRWRRVELTRRGSAVTVAYDGAVVGSFEAGGQAATGTLRVGRLARPFSNGQDQFYGFIDDLSLSSPELGRPFLLDFDEPRQGGVAALSLGGNARLTVVSRERRAELDELRLPTPEHRTKLMLPFAAGQVWMPIQGTNSALSHHDIAAFAIDFIRVEPGFVTDNPRHVPGGSHRASWGEPILAPAAGQVTSLVDTHEDDAPSSNFVCVQHEAHEVSCLLHLQPGASAREST
ncbi:MAG TPA: hypothetical protein VEQ59_02525, partial [Polyangiaceae bacterium]|nr:hypothetical protein [Polyangiaceae bacterium]